MLPFLLKDFLLFSDSMESRDNIYIIGKHQCMYLAKFIFLVLKCSEIDHPHLIFTGSFWGPCLNFPEDVSDVMADVSKKKR